MKQTLFLGLAVAGIALIPLTANATSDDQKYPATNYQPKVIYIDKEAIAKPETTTATDARYPASSFQPKVIYIDEEATKKPTRKKAVFDPKYPATNFEPKIVYPAN